MKTYFIYKYEWEDGSVYIGQTFHGSKRYGRIEAYKSSPLVYRKMLDFPNFNKCIVKDNISKENIDSYEKYYIKKYNSFYKKNSKFGLNLTIGGQSIPSRKKRVYKSHSKED